MTKKKKKLNMTIYLKILTVELHVFYIFKMHVKFCSKWILITI